MKDDKIYILHIRDSISIINKYTKTMNKEAFLVDELVQNTVIRQIQIIGEASKNLSKELKGRYKHVPWKEMVGMRNVLVHKYFGIDLTAVWKAVKEDIPELENAVLRILAEIDKMGVGNDG
jgi:uncharacterized protein with HEPN domain